MGESNLMVHIYLQDKRARKRIPAVGTKKYPMLWVGIGSVNGNEITVSNANSLYVIGAGREHERKYRTFVSDGEGIHQWIDKPEFKLDASI